MKKIAVLILAGLMALTLVACSTEKNDLTSIGDYIAPSNEHKIDTGTLTFAEGPGETAIIADYVGLYTTHDIVLPETIGERTVTSIGEAAFYYCTAAKSIKIPSSVTTIEDWAFAGCTSLETIVIPATVKSIGKGAFNGCTSLKSVVFEGTVLETIEDYAFRDCSALETIVLPEGLKEIGIEAFRDCEAITALKTPTTLEKIGNLAFFNCKGLNTQGALELTASIAEFGEFVFSGINKIYITAPEGSEAAKYVAEMREFEEESESETETQSEAA